MVARKAKYSCAIREQLNVRIIYCTPTSRECFAFDDGIIDHRIMSPNMVKMGLKVTASFPVTFHACIAVTNKVRTHDALRAMLHRASAPLRVQAKANRAQFALYSESITYRTSQKVNIIVKLRDRHFKATCSSLLIFTTWSCHVRIRKQSHTKD